MPMRFRVDDKASKSISTRSVVKAKRSKQRDEITTRDEIEPIDEFDDDPSDLWKDYPDSDFEGKESIYILEVLSQRVTFSRNQSS